MSLQSTALSNPAVRRRFHTWSTLLLHSLSLGSCEQKERNGEATHAAIQTRALLNVKAARRLMMPRARDACPSEMKNPKAFITKLYYVSLKLCSAGTFNLSTF